jgi:transposase
MQTTTTIGLDLAKDVFQVHGVDAGQKLTLKRQLKRRGVVDFFARLPPCLVGMEACAGAHYWARELGKLGHRVRIMSPRYVKGYAKRGKTDAADAAAICEAVTRAYVETVAVKSEDQQCLLMLHKTRDLLIAERRSLANALRAHLLELGIVAPAGHTGFATLRAKLLDDLDTDIAAMARAALLPLEASIGAHERGIADLEARIRAVHKVDETSRRLEAVPSVGVFGATAFAAVAADIKGYRSARCYASSLGLTPKIFGTGGEVTLGPITKQGNGYLRRLLYLGAVARLGAAQRAPHKADPNLLRLLAEKPFKVAAIALANRTARTIWALVVRGGDYIANHLPVVPMAAGQGALR